MTLAKPQAASRLDWLGMLVFEGPETRHFLQGQLSCDTEKLQTGHWTWGGYLTPKGRLLSSFVAVALGDESIGLVMDKELIVPVQKKLKMYQLRAKTSSSIDDRNWAGLWDQQYGKEDQKVVQGDPDVGQILCLGGKVALAFGADYPVEQSVADGFMVACARGGLPWLRAPLLEQLTAQMLSLDLAGGIDFDKGCFVGQEIVIRAQHRGAIKKRCFVIEGQGEVPKSGAEVLSEIHGGQVAGQFVYGGRDNGRFCGLASLRKDAVDGAIELDDGRDIAAIPPPYGLLDERFEKA